MRVADCKDVLRTTGLLPELYCFTNVINFSRVLYDSTSLIINATNNKPFRSNAPVSHKYRPVPVLLKR
jgi:hypothetical protein